MGHLSPFCHYLHAQCFNLLSTQPQLEQFEQKKKIASICFKLGIQQSYTLLMIVPLYPRVRVIFSTAEDHSEEIINFDEFRCYRDIFILFF